MQRPVFISIGRIMVGAYGITGTKALSFQRRLENSHKAPRDLHETPQRPLVACAGGVDQDPAAIAANKAKVEAANSSDRIATDLIIKEIEAEIEAQKEASAIILAEQGRWYTAIIRPLLAFPLIVYLWKVIVWDTVLGLGTTEPLTGLLAEWTGMIVIAYVGGRSIEKVARIFRR